jgi:hypothetical protein
VIESYRLVSAPDPGDVLQVDDFFFGFAQGVRFLQAQGFEVVTIIARDIQEAFRAGVFEVFPPQAEEQGAVFQFGKKLLDAPHQRHGGLVLGVGGKHQPGEAIDAVRQAGGLFRMFENFHEAFHVHAGVQFGAELLEFCNLFFKFPKGRFKFRRIGAGKRSVRLQGARLTVIETLL